MTAPFQTLPPPTKRATPRRTKLPIDDTRSLICMGVGPDVERKLLEKLGEIRGRVDE